ncbi:MAG: 30S ribosomal protein S12 methylthiotransferase RimO, partial [Deltaproteobacteria bacterium]|nr:30S ribosomal protein S12 methylthiotransferase RimO [Deltaproteobacteria bacterium]
KSGSAVSEAVDKLRRMIPGVTLRTSLIVGFPGETEEDFQQLLDFVEEAQFDRLGVFKYSVEEGTPAALMGNHLPEQEKEIRWQEVMDLQASISRKKNESLIGTLQLVMIDRYDAESARWLGRTQAHAPEVDGLVYLVAGRMDRGGAKFRPGDLARARITGALDYDLIGAILAD